MSVPMFTIPLHLKDLEDDKVSGDFLVTDTMTTTEISQGLLAASVAENEEGIYFIVDHFATFYCLIKHFKKIPVHSQDRGLKILLKAFKKLTLNLSHILEEGMDSELQFKVCNVTKMIGYLLIELAKCFQGKFIQESAVIGKGKGKKNVKTEELQSWVDEKTEMMGFINEFLQLPIKMLWDPPVADDEFLDIFANFCYTCLEDVGVSGASMKTFRTALFEVLATLIRKHLHGISFSVKIVQLLRMHEHLASPLAQGVLTIVNSGCTNVVRGIVREMGESDEALLSDAGGARCLSQFLTAVAEASPAAVSSSVELLMSFLSRDPPALRCCALTVLGEVVQAILTKEDLEDELKASRDTYLEVLEEHIHDNNAFVRSRALQVWQKLCTEKAIPVARLQGLLELAISRLGDKSSNVKKQAVQLIKVMLEGNPYSGELDVTEISNQLDVERKKLNNLLVTHNLKVEHCEDDWSSLEAGLRDELTNDHHNSVAIEGMVLEEALKIIGEKLKRKDASGAVGILNQLKDEFYEQLGVKADDDVEASLQVLKKIWEQSTAAQVPEVSEDILDKKDALERGISYLEGALEFATLIDRALPLTLTLLDSSTQSDVLEAISFFTAAHQFGFSKSAEGVRRMLYLVLSKEQGIKTAVCNAYKDLYFSNPSSGRKRNLDAVSKMSRLVIELNLSQMDAMEEVVRDWVKNDIIDKPCIQILFERFSKKIAGTTEADSWAALALISMIGSEQPKIIRNNQSVLVNEGLGTRGSTNFALAQYACKALQKLPSDGSRLCSDDEILLRLLRLLREGLWSSATQHHFVPFADEAISLVFALAERPDAFCETLLIDMFNSIKDGKRPVAKQPRGRMLAKKNDDEDLFSEPMETDEKDNESSMSSEQNCPAEIHTNENDEAVILRLTRFLSILGTVAAHYIGFVDTRVLNELKRRNQVDYEKKVKRQEDKRSGDVSVVHTEKEELEFMRQSADDMHTEQLKKLAEEKLVAGEGLLGKFMPLILAICKQPGKYPNQPLQNAALLALGMFMQVSGRACDENLQILVTLTEKSQNTAKRRNGLLLLWALQFRFPNSLEPWTSHMVALLRDNDTAVRRTAVNVITHLIVNEMIKARSHLADLAVCLVDKDFIIAQTIRHFFREFSHKGNALYNVLPSLVMTLTGPDAPLDEENFHIVMKFVLELITKDKQQDLLVEKICQYFECATTDRQCRDLAFCLSLLHYSEKSLRKVLENFRCFGNKLYIAEVYEAFMTILAQCARNPQKDKILLDDLQGLVKEYREKSCSDRNVAVTLPTKRCPPSTRKRVPRRQQVSSCSENEESQEDEKPAPVIAPRSTRKASKAAVRRFQDLSEDEVDIKDEPASEDDIFVKKKPQLSLQRQRRIVVSSSDSDSDNGTHKITRVSKVTSKKTRAKHEVVCNSNSDDEIKRPVRSTRKRR